MKKARIQDIRIPNNYLLIKPDPDFEFVEVDPASGFEINNEPVKIWIGYDSETHARHFGITGRVLVVPDQLVFNRPRIEKYKKKLGSGRMMSDQVAIACLMGASQEIDVEMEAEPGDKVWFSYLCQLNAVVDKLLIDTEEEGLCFLVRYEDLYCYERDGQQELVNGWVWINRIKKAGKTEGGIDLNLNESNQYQKGRALIVKSGKAIREYMDGYKEDSMAFNGGEQISYNGSMGHPVEYVLHRKLHDEEVYSIRRRHIYAVI